MALGAITTLRAIVIELEPIVVLKLDSGATINLPAVSGLSLGTEVILQVQTPAQAKATTQDLARAFLAAIITAS